jgi:hypothetical protein
MPREKRRMNIAIIAGYNVKAYESENHIRYVAQSLAYVYALGGDIDLIATLGGATNPDFPELTEASANAKILESLNWPESRTIMIPEGDVPEESLHALIRELRRRSIIDEKTSLGKIIVCAEAASLTGWMMDGLFKGFLDLGAEGIYAYGHRFPESGEYFGKQRKKMFLQVLSYKFSFFRFIRLALQKRHQEKMAKTRRE